MICIECNKPISKWDISYLDESGNPKYYTETKAKNYIERLPLCGPECSLIRFQKNNGQKQ
jgi:hypothetical protein